MKKPIYLDYSATTPVDPRVAAKMIPYLTEHFGNPASRSHSFGWETEKAVEEARAEVARLVNCDPREIVWTSGATEACVIVAGWQIKLSTPPRLSAKVQTFTASKTVRAASSDPTSNDTMLPKPFCCRFASSCCLCDLEPG